MSLEQSLANLSLGTQADTDIQNKMNMLGIKSKLVKTEKDLVQMLDALQTAKTLSVDFEGIDLCKTGKICLGQFHAHGSQTVFTVDFVEIKNPFVSADGRLKTLLENESVLKVFYDPRSDADATFHQFNVSAKHVLCLQVAEVCHCFLFVSDLYLFYIGSSQEKPRTSCFICFRSTKRHGQICDSPIQPKKQSHVHQERWGQTLCTREGR
jgi:hypothetical protein